MKKIVVVLLLLFCCGGLSAQSYRIGDLYTAPDGSQGIVFYVFPGGDGGWVVALDDAYAGCSWGPYGDVPGLTNRNPTYTQQMLNDTAGYANTQVLRGYQNSSDYAAGKVDFANGWFLPTPAQMMALFSQLPFITSAIINAGGTALGSGNYWCSSEGNASYAWSASMGGWGTRYKSLGGNVRAVRCFSMENAGVYYLWNTGDTTQGITVTPTETTTYTVAVSMLDGSTDTLEHTIVVKGGSVDTIHQISDGSYEWNGNTYTHGGYYSQSYSLPNGCDSVVVLHLTVSIVPEVTIVATDDTICAGDEVTLEAVLTNAEYILQIPPIAAGDILCTDNTIVKPSDWPVQGKTAMGVVFYVDNTGEHGWAMHLQNQGTNMIWGNQGDIQTLTNYPEGRTALQDYDGQSNTQKIRNKGGSSTYPSAWAVDFANGWYLPSIGQLAVFVSELETVDATLALLGATTFPPDEYFRMWSSTESGSAHAWCIQGTGEIENHVYKNITSTHFIVRSVRSF